jgi:hypothetical protein
VSERPVFALPGAFPAYRDLVPGLTGKDVQQLRDGLAKLGIRSYDRREYFGPSTAAAVRRFYERIGYAVPVAPAQPPAQSQDVPVAPAQPQDPPGTGAATEPEPQPMVPRSEVAFLPALPARVAAFAVGVGGLVKDPLITFSTGGIALTARADPQNAGLITVGMRADVVAEATGFTGAGSVAEIGAPVTDTAGANAGQDGTTSAPYIPLLIAPPQPWPENLASSDVRVTITTAGTQSEVLAVPQAAISSTADGRTWVTVVPPAGGQRVVDVTAGISADGYVEVTPNGAELRPGDRVVTGR